MGLRPSTPNVTIWRRCAPKSLSSLFSIHVLYPAIVEIVDHAPRPKRRVLDHRDEFTIERVLPMMDSFLAVYLVREGDILQSLENDKIGTHLVAEGDERLYFSWKFSN